MIPFILMVVALILFILAALHEPRYSQLLTAGLASMAGSFVFQLYPG